MMDLVTLALWLYLVYCTARTPKHKPKVRHQTQYAPPFDVWMQFKTGEQYYTLISNNQN